MFHDLVGIRLDNLAKKESFSKTLNTKNFLSTYQSFAITFSYLVRSRRLQVFYKKAALKTFKNSSPKRRT